MMGLLVFILLVLSIAVTVGLLIACVLARNDSNSNMESCRRCPIVAVDSACTTSAGTVRSPRESHATHDLADDDNLAARFPRVAVRGACSYRGTCDVDWLYEGTLLYLSISGNSVRVVHGDDGRIVGILPLQVSQRYIACNARHKYKKVVVDKDVNLNDKYGQLFVRWVPD